MATAGSNVWAAACFLCCRLCVVVLNVPLIIIATRGYEVGLTL
jgi:hypothetical protein